MVAIDHLFAKCSACGIFARQDYEGHAAMASFGPGARVAVVCAACGARRDYVMQTDPRRERELQRENRRLAAEQREAADALRAAALARALEDEEEWAMLRAEMLGLFAKGGSDG